MMRSTKSIRTAKIGSIMMAAALSAMGVSLILFPEVSATTLCYVLGGLLAAYGIIKVVGYFSKDLYRLAFQYDLAYGALLAAVGLIMLLHPEGFIAVLYIVMGILFLADGLFKIQMAIDAKRFGVGKWWLIIALAALTGLVGLLLILRPFEGAKAVMILLGISLLAEGVLSISVALCTVKIIKHQQPDVIEAIYTETKGDQEV